MTTDIEDNIPIDSQLRDFRNYLNANKRCILSARFGDGKSYFLSKFIEENKSDYLFIPIYPVNYQVADNKDIFEYIKRDILIRLLSSGKIDIDGSEISNACYIYSFLKENGLSCAWNILTHFPFSDINLNSSDMSVEKIKLVLVGLKKLKDKFIDYKDTKFKSDEKKAEEAIEREDNTKGSIYEFDTVSQLICDLIDQYRKEHDGNKVVLLIEDLDRIDPAHIFRILNVFSAHFDRYNKSWNETRKQGGSYENKFKFDKIVTVCHYENIKNIYHHCYGSKTDFNGYIGKYSSSKPFFYSLESEIKHYIIRNIDDSLRVFSKMCDRLASLIVEKYKNTENGLWGNIRQIRHSFEQDDNIREEKIYIDEGIVISSVNRLTRLLDLLNRFDLKWQDLYSQNKEENNMGFEEIIGECYLYAKHADIALAIRKVNNSQIGISFSEKTNYNLGNLYYTRLPMTIRREALTDFSINFQAQNDDEYKRIKSVLKAQEQFILDHFGSYVTNFSWKVIK
ncbi:MAG: hypothetical protein H6Q14_2113 [Bacteroidetes bacterium]|nr:hypothetical protein [Bacteroidota bacterium]